MGAKFYYAYSPKERKIIEARSMERLAQYFGVESWQLKQNKKCRGYTVYTLEGLKKELLKGKDNTLYRFLYKHKDKTFNLVEYKGKNKSTQLGIYKWPIAPNDPYACYVIKDVRDIKHTVTDATIEISKDPVDVKYSDLRRELFDVKYSDISEEVEYEK